MSPDWTKPRGTYRVGKISIWITAAIVILVSGYILLGRSALLDVEELEVHGLHQLTLEQVDGRLGFRVGDPLLSLDLGESQRKLEGLPWVKSVNVDRSWSGTITIDVTEHKAVALALTEPERWALIAEDGTVLSNGLMAPPELPRLTGVHAAGSPGTYLASDSSALLSLLTAMPTNLVARFFSLRRDAEGEIRGTLQNTQEVIFGDDKRLAAKIIALSALLDHLENEERMDRHIDISVPEKAVVRSE